MSTTAGLASGSSPHAGPDRLAFHADPDGADDVFTIATAGQRASQATRGLEAIAAPVWSPDGKRLAVLGRPSGVADVYVMGADGSALRQLTDGEGEHYGLRWSPDGRWLAYSCCDQQRMSVYLYDLAAGRAHRLIENAAQPAFSPDSSRLAYITLDRAAPDIAIARIDGSQRRRLATHPSEDADPEWSPEGRLVAFDSKRGGRSQIYVVSVDGKRLRRLSRDRWTDQEPRWSPGGDALVFTSYRNRDPTTLGIGNAELVTVRLADGRRRNLTRSPAWEGYPAWSPSGREIAFAVRSDFGARGSFQLGVISQLGGRRRLLPAPRDSQGRPSNACCPAWRPVP